MNRKTLTILMMALLIVGSFSFLAMANEQVKIGFLVKQPEEPWFQDEWKYAQRAADEFGFELITIGATDGEQVLSAIDNLAAQGAQGFIICTPDVQLGPAIVARANMHGLKLQSVDDRFVGSDGNEMEDVHHMGISAYNIGVLVGETLAQQMDQRGWDPSEVGLLRMSFDQTPTIKERTDGATDALLAAGFPEENIFDSAMRTLDQEGSFNAANISINRNSHIKYWLVAGGNDSSVIGAIRALEGQGFGVDEVVGVGINGANVAINEFEKSSPTGFYASVKLSAEQHGYETARNMYFWISEGQEPDKLIYTNGELMTRENYQELMD